MSGIYIPNIEMPDDCIHCPCADLEYFDCNLMPGTGTDHKKRREGCPLIPVPEHGRLIDKDWVAAEEGPYDYEDWVNWKLDRFMDAPVVIPADKEGEP